MYEMVKYPKYLIYDDEQIINNKGKWSLSVFKNNNPLSLEIGSSGSAMFTNELARLNPNVNIGVEIRFKRLVQG